MADTTMRNGFFLGILIIALTLQGCGRKGPLRLPQTQTAAPVTAPTTPDAIKPDAHQPDAQKPDTPSIQPAN